MEAVKSTKRAVDVVNRKDSNKKQGIFNRLANIFQSDKAETSNIKLKIDTPSINNSVPINNQMDEQAPEPVIINDSNQSKQNKLFDDKLESDLQLISDISNFLKETEVQQAIENSFQNENPTRTNSTTIDALPIEIICKIIDYLEFNERKNASLVCKKWRNAFLESYYLKDIMVKANNHLFISSRPSSASIQPSSSNSALASTSLTPFKHRSASSMALSSYSSLTSFNYHLYNNLVNLEFDNDSADVNLLLKNLRRQNYDNQVSLPKLKNLKFSKTTMSSKTLIEMLNEAPNLEVLNLIQCDSLFMTGFLTIGLNQEKIFNLPNLKVISLSKNRYLTDYLLNLFLNSAENLESLDISFCLLTKTNYKSISNQQKKTIQENNVGSSAVVLTLENLIKQAPKLQTLTSINLSGIEMFNHDEESLINLIDILPNLTEIYLSNLPTLKVNTVIKLFERVPNLKLIDLISSIQIDDPNVKSIEHCLEKSASLHEDSTSRLEVLKLSRAKINNPKLLADQISNLTRLTYLDLSCIMFQYSFGTIDRLNQYINQFANDLSKCQNLQYLLLSYCDFIVNDTFIKIISKKMKNLKHLDLRNCSQLTDQSVHYICTYLTKLVHLDLSWCQNISDYGLDRSISYGSNKKLLNEFNKHLNGSCRCIRKYTEQPFLLIKTKNEINSEIKKQFCNCVGVEIEETTENTNNNNKQNDNPDDELKADVSIKNLRFLKVLKLESCINISDIGLYNAINLPQLTELDIKLCTNVNGDFIYSYLSNQDNKKIIFNNLKILNLNQCIKFKEDNLIFITERSPNLRELSISAIPTITNNLIESLLKIRKLLVLFDISFCPSINESFVEKYEQFLYNEFGLREFFIDKRFISK